LHPTVYFIPKMIIQVKISRLQMESMVERAARTRREQIGLLLGNMKESRATILEAIFGSASSTTVTTRMDPAMIATVTGEVVQGKRKGNIIGWFHTHPGHGIFLSSTDTKTHGALAQFSPSVLAMVIDPDVEAVGIFSLTSDGRVGELEPKKLVRTPGFEQEMLVFEQKIEEGHRKMRVLREG